MGGRLLSVGEEISLRRWSALENGSLGWDDIGKYQTRRGQEGTLPIPPERGVSWDSGANASDSPDGRGRNP
jgi:hypothetical protein